jgi:hypothetical protein
VTTALLALGQFDIVNCDYSTAGIGTVRYSAL